MAKLQKNRKKVSKKAQNVPKSKILTEKDAKKVFLMWKSATKPSERDKLWNRSNLVLYANKYRDLFKRYNKPIAFKK